ncbi:MAG: hypothetical protein R3D45_06715 [Rhizobiaceae bacterium]
MKKIRFVIGLVISCSAIIIPFFADKFSASDYSVPLFYVYRFRLEIFVAGLVALLATIGVGFPALLTAFWQRASPGQRLFLSIGSSVLAVFMIAFSWGDISRYVVERGRYFEGEIAADYRRFLVLVGDEYYLARQIDLAIGYWENSGDPRAAEKARIAKRRKAISSYLMEKAVGFEGEYGENIRSYTFAIQAIYFDPENRAAIGKVQHYVDELEASRSTDCAARVDRTWIALGYRYGGQERCSKDISIYEKWYIDDVTALLTELERGQIERASIFDLLKQSETATLHNAKFTINEASILSRLPRRVFNIGRSVDDYLAH